MKNGHGIWKHGSLLIIGAGCIMFSACNLNAKQATLAEKGQAVAVIVLPDEPIPSEQTAAAELSAYLHKVTGAEFKIVKERAAGAAPAKSRIFIGPSKAATRVLGNKQVEALGPEDFIVRAAGGDLLLVGGRPRGRRRPSAGGRASARQPVCGLFVSGKRGRLSLVQLVRRRVRAAAGNLGNRGFRPA